MNLTEWYPAYKYKPTRIGQYEVRLSYISGIRKRYWDGERWLFSLDGISGPSMFGTDPYDYWRGLAAPYEGYIEVSSARKNKRT